MALDADKYRLSETDHQAIFDNEIKPNLFANSKPSDRPVAVIFGGQPGAGKSAAIEAALRDLEARGGAVQIIGDDLRNFHPQNGLLLKADDKTAAFYTDRDTGRWVEKAIAEAKAQRVNIVIEGTMRDGSKVADTMQSLRAAGYEIDARALAVNERISQQGILQRYEKQKATRGTGRMTTLEAHKAAFDGMPVTLERIERDKLADRLTLYRRGAEAIYTNELQAGEWVKHPQARAVLEAERSRPMTLQECRSYAEGFDRLAELMARSERQASAAEIENVNTLRQRAKQELAVTLESESNHEHVKQRLGQHLETRRDALSPDAYRQAAGLAPIRSRQDRGWHEATVNERSPAQGNREDAGLNRDPAQAHATATRRITENVEALKQNPALAGKSSETLERLAYWRGVVQEDIKHKPPAAQEADLAKFDRKAEDPAFLEKLEQSATRAPEEHAAPARGREDDFEQSM